MPVKTERQYRSMSMSAEPQNEKLIDTEYYVDLRRIRSSG